jgi:SAM-dependent methyltransferase
VSSQREQDIERIRAAYEAYDEHGRASLWDKRNAGFARVARDRDEVILYLLRRCLDDSPARRVLDVGCGAGGLAVLCRGAGLEDVAVTGVDLLPDRLAQARERAPEATFVEASADALPFGPAVFPIAAAVTLFSSLPSAEMETAAAQELRRVVEPGGWLIWFDLRRDNPGNRAVHGIGRARLAELFPGWAIDIRSTTLAPPIARRLGRATPLLYPVLEALPPLRSHLIGRLRCPT